MDAQNANEVKRAIAGARLEHNMTGLHDLMYMGERIRLEAIRALATATVTEEVSRIMGDTHFNTLLAMGIDKYIKLPPKEEPPSSEEALSPTYSPATPSSPRFSPETPPIEIQVAVTTRIEEVPPTIPELVNPMTLTHSEDEEPPRPVPPPTAMSRMERSARGQMAYRGRRGNNGTRIPLYAVGLSRAYTPVPIGAGDSPEEPIDVDASPPYVAAPPARASASPHRQGIPTCFTCGNDGH